MQQFDKYAGYVPLKKIVSAAMVDTYNLDGSKEELFVHWAARGMRKLYDEILPRFRDKFIIPVNCNTKTATLPCGVEDVSFVGVIRGGRKYPLQLDGNLVNSKTFTTQKADCCSKCGQDKSICNTLKITESTNKIKIGTSFYDEDVIKRLYPNGDYMLERHTPFLDSSSETVQYRDTKEFITNFDLLECGCLNPCVENTQKLAEYCPLAYADSCECCAESEPVKYRVIEETGLIQLSQNSDYDELYVECTSYIPKVNGSYVVPKVAFETLVEWTKYKSIQNKNNVPYVQKAAQLEDYKRERRNMEKAMFKKGISLDMLITKMLSVPTITMYSAGQSKGSSRTPMQSVVPATPQNVKACEALSPACGTTINNNNITIVNAGLYTIAAKEGVGTNAPIIGNTTYQNDDLKGASNIEYIIISNTIETLLAGDFTFNSTTGTIDRSPKVFASGDTLVINYNKT